MKIIKKIKLMLFNFRGKGKIPENKFYFYGGKKIKNKNYVAVKSGYE
jgi:hypothetical protein